MQIRSFSVGNNNTKTKTKRKIKKNSYDATKITQSDPKNKINTDIEGHCVGAVTAAPVLRW